MKKVSPNSSVSYRFEVCNAQVYRSDSEPGDTKRREFTNSAHPAHCSVDVLLKNVIHEPLSRAAKGVPVMRRDLVVRNRGDEQMSTNNVDDYLKFHGELSPQNVNVSPNTMHLSPALQNTAPQKVLVSPQHEDPTGFFSTPKGTWQ